MRNITVAVIFTQSVYIYYIFLHCNIGHRHVNYIETNARRFWKTGLIYAHE